MYSKIISSLLVLSIGLTACSFNVNLPITTITPGPTVTDQIDIPLPASTGKVTALSLEFGAGTLNLNPGADVLVSGTATYNLPDFKPEVVVNGNTVLIKQGRLEINGIQNIPDLSKVKNEWDLFLGSTPINLTIEAGAYKAEYQFGGLMLTNLVIKDGAAETRLDFSLPNQAEMAILRYETGASNVTLSGLGNANFASLEFISGAGNYTLDFSGKPTRDSNVHIKTGLSNLTLAIPVSVAAQVTVEGGLANVIAGTEWIKNGNMYTQSGSNPILTVVVEIGAGNLSIIK